ncbi:MAG: hypothetical protein DWQ56_10040 [Microcystis aeruginosa DA14]|uniref:Uncharacterized protein n=1 Tax=Microcystis aeruginosa DA14 TaxID=1987506 RepID=A0A3E0MFW2_MICAE|nr:MAG: hypothetical protein DWQ56_10040 [Microcystis aeruginosa DA14]
MKGGSPRLSAPPLSRGDPPAYRHPPYQGGQGGSNRKSIFTPLDGSSYRKQKPNSRRLCPINWIFPVFINYNLPSIP